MFVPLRTDSPLRSRPWMNWGLIGANIAVFLLMQAFPQWREALWLNPRHLTLSAYFTYPFIHASVAHLLGNLLFLYIFGNNVNDKMGPAGYLAFYLAGGVVAGAGHVAVSWQPVLGASGAVAAVTGAYLVLLPRSNIVILWFFWIIHSFEIPSLWFILFFFMQDLLMAAMPAWFSGAPMVAHAAHISGMLFGVALCLLLLKLRLLPRNPFDMPALIHRWMRRRQFRKLVRDGFDPFGQTAPSMEDAPQPNPRTTELRRQITEALERDDLSAGAAIYLHLRRMDSNVVLSRTALLDIANHLMHQQDHANAATAYEQLLGAYPNHDQVEQVQLMLGLLYARYLNRPDRAREHLHRAMAKLRRERDLDIAQAELSKLAALQAT